MSYAEDLEIRCEEKLVEAIVQSPSGDFRYVDGGWYSDGYLCMPPKHGDIKIWQGCSHLGYTEIYSGRVERVRHLLSEMFERYI